MTTARNLKHIAGLCALAILACGREDFTHVGRPPVIEGFAPTQRTMTTFVGDTLTFSVEAFDPDRNMLDQYFTLDDRIVASGPLWNYVVDDTGSAVVGSVTSDGTYSTHLQWSLDRRVAIDYPPVISAFSPLEKKPTMIVGTTLRFAVSARDPENQPLIYQFTVDDVVLSAEKEFDYTAPSVGEKLVRVSVDDGNHAVSHDWQLKVTEVPDTIPPASISPTLAETGQEPGEIDLEWTAVGADGNQGIASQYLVRTSPVPIDNETEWSRASERPNVPLPLPAGQTMRMTINDLTPARYTFIAIRAIDDFGNLSPLGQSPGVYAKGMYISGHVYNALTRAPVPNIRVDLAQFSAVTDDTGAYEFLELPPLIHKIEVADEYDPGVIGDYFDYRRDYTVKHLDVVDVYLIPNEPLDTEMYANFYVFYRSMTDLGGIPIPSATRRWAQPIDIYVPPLTRNGLDYKQTIEDVTKEFDSILGVPLFHLVDSPPDVGVTIVYDGSISADNYFVTEWSSDWYPVKARIEHRLVYTTDTKWWLELVARHELGHALGLGHSLDIYHLMIGGQTPSGPWFKRDELNVIKVLYTLPRGTNLLDTYQD